MDHYIKVYKMQKQASAKVMIQKILYHLEILKLYHKK